MLELSHIVEHGMVTYPGLPAPEIDSYLSFEESRSHYDAGTEFSIGRVTMVGNTGTYLDAPAHRFPDGHDLAGLALASVANLPATVLAVGGAIGPEVMPDTDLAGHAVLLRTGWDVHWRTERYGATDHPFLTGPAAEVLVAAGVALVGIDSVNIDDTRGGSRPAHTALLAAGIPIVEHLTGLGELPATGARFFAVPAMVAGMTSFPVRAFAILDDAPGM